MLDSYRDLNEELLGTPTALRTLLEAHAPAEAGTDVVRLIAELRDRDRAVLARLQTMMRERNPHLHALALPNATADDAADVATVLTELDAARGDLISLLINLTLKDWERTATHEIDGEISLAEEVERHVEFDEDHVARIRAAVAMA